MPEESTKWGQLLALANQTECTWLADDLAQIWRHQLQVPLEVELAEAFPGFSPSNYDLPMPRTFAELLKHPAPPMDLLVLVKNLAKVRRGQAGFPSEIATALYHAAIAIGVARHGQRMTELDDAALAHGFQWTLRQSWLDESTRGVVESALRSVLAA
jgi:hypothetical protein